MSRHKKHAGLCLAQYNASCTAHLHFFGSYLISDCTVMDELDGLIELVDQQMQLRSEALLLLKQRGRDIRKYLRPGP